MEPRDEARWNRHGVSRDGTTGHPLEAKADGRRPGEHAAPGSGFPGLGAPEGRRTPREEERDEGLAAVGQTGSADRNADEILEGERKSRSGIQPEG